MSAGQRDWPALFFAAIVSMLCLSVGFGGINEAAKAKRDAKALRIELRDAGEAYERMLAPQIVNIDLVLDQIRVHESVGGTILEGDSHLGRCGQSIGAYHMRVSTLEWLRATDRVVAPRGCEAQRKWLMDEANARYAAKVYLELLLQRTGDLNLALCLYNAGHNSTIKVCTYSGKVREGTTA